MPVEILVLIEQEFQISKNANGIHNIRFYMHGNKIISFFEFQALKFKNKPNLKYFDHAGVKFQLTDELSLFSLFTSNDSTFLPDNFIMKNVKLDDNIHLYMNQLSIISNNSFSHFFTISDNLNHFPKYCKKFHNRINLFSFDTINAYKHALYLHNFNDPFVVIDHIIGYHEDGINKLSIQNKMLNNKFMRYSKHTELLHIYGLNNNDIFKFAENFIRDKKLNGDSLYSNNLFFDKTNKRFINI